MRPRAQRDHCYEVCASAKARAVCGNEYNSAALCDYARWDRKFPEFLNHVQNPDQSLTPAARTMKGTSRREDTLDTVIALRRPEDYSPEQGARFEIHLEKLRNRVDAAELAFSSNSVSGEERSWHLTGALRP